MKRENCPGAAFQILIVCEPGQLVCCFISKADGIIYGVYRLKSSRMPANTQIYISTIQRMYSILKSEDLDESAEETPFSEYVTADSKAPKVPSACFQRKSGPAC